MNSVDSSSKSASGICSDKYTWKGTTMYSGMRFSVERGLSDELSDEESEVESEVSGKTGDGGNLKGWGTPLKKFLGKLLGRTVWLGTGGSAAMGAGSSTKSGTAEYLRGLLVGRFLFLG